jgi:transaldolase
VSFYAQNEKIAGFTTNPTIFRAHGIETYLEAARQLIEVAYPKKVSLEVIRDDMEGMYRQAKVLHSLGNNVTVKIPITNTQRLSTLGIVRKLLLEGIAVNLTAVFTLNQIQDFLENPFHVETPLIISVFAGRLADIGHDPEQALSKFVEIKKEIDQNWQILWASPREVFNVIQAQRIGCDIITLTPELIKKMSSFGRDPEEFSLDTVKMFAKDAAESSYQF